MKSYSSAVAITDGKQTPESFDLSQFQEKFIPYL